MKIIVNYYYISEKSKLITSIRLEIYSRSRPVVLHWIFVQTSRCHVETTWKILNKTVKEKGFRRHRFQNKNKTKEKDPSSNLGGSQFFWVRFLPCCFTTDAGCLFLGSLCRAPNFKGKKKSPLNFFYKK